jgi:predicted esterase
MTLKTTRVLIALCLLFLPSLSITAQTNFKTDRTAIAERIATLEIEENTRFQVVRDLLEIDPEIGFLALKDSWKQVRSPEAKTALLNTFLASANPHLVEITYLGATDANFNVQNFALNVAESICFRSFTDDYNAYLTWYKTAQARPLTQVLNEGIEEYVKRYKQADDGTRELLLSQLVNRNFSATTRIAKARRKAVLESGLMDALAKGMEPVSPLNLQQLSFQLCRGLRPNEAFLRKVILPLCRKDQLVTTRMQAIGLLGAPENSWAVPELLKMAVEEYPDQLFFNFGQVLGMIGDAQAIPTLIALLDADNTRESALSIGSVLAQITGVFVNEAHDAAWWKNWYNKNRLRLPENLRDTPLPRLNVKKRQAMQSINGMASIRSEARQALGTPQSTYWLLTPNRGMRAPERLSLQNNGLRSGKGLGLLVVLTPGDGNGANAISAWMEIVQEQLKGRYMIALPVAPRWSADQKTTWLTQNTKGQTKEAKFSTEEFVNGIVKEVGQNFNLDRERVFIYGAMDSGIAAYSALLESNTLLKGAYLTTSPFKTTLLPPLKAAKGRRFFLQHSRQDKTTPFLIAATAQKLLSDSGGVVKLLAYEDTPPDEVLKSVGIALEWLETGK